MKKITLLFLLMFAFCWQSQAQLESDDSCTTAFEDISATFDIEIVATDDSEHNFTLPYSFTLDGVSSSDLRIGTNGGILFNATTGDVFTSSSPTAEGFYPFSDDLDIQTNDKIYVQTLGTAPNRRTIIQYQDKAHNNYTTGGITFQVVLYETLNEIAFIYQDIVFGSATYDNGISAGVRVVGANGAYVYSNNEDISGVSCIYWSEPSCVFPSNLDATAITTIQAELSWVEGGTASLYNVEVVEAGTPATGVATDTGVANPFTKTGLMPSTNYEFYVQADCTGGDLSAWVGPFSFSTLCATVSTFPWTEDFETTTGSSLPNCWSENNNNADTDFWKTWTTYGVGGTRAVGLYTDFNSGNNDDYLILPQFTLTGAERLKYNVRARSAGEPNDYKVVISTTGNAPADFSTDLLGLTQVSNTTHTEEIIDLSAYSGDVFIAIHVPSGGLDGYYIYFDDFTVEEIPSCVAPSDLAATNIMTTSADLGWTENGSASLYNVEVVETGNTPSGTATDTGVANGFTKSGLLPSVTYDYYVQADCTGGDVSTWVGPYTFTTLCEPFTASYTQNFDAESTPDINTCWSTFINDATSTFANVQTSSTQSVSASNSVRFYNSSDTAGEYYLVSPNFSDLDNTKRVKFNLYQNQGTSDEGDTIEIGTMADPSDASTFTLIEAIPYANRTEDEWTEFTVNFDAYTGTDNYVAIKMTFGGTYNYYYYDDFVYEEIPSCVEPSMLMVSNLTSDSADLSWTAEGAETMWNIELVDVTAGGMVTGTATATGVSNPYNATGLAANNDYAFYVQADCGGETSTWVGPFTFYTGYCIPSGTSTTTYIDGFTTTTSGGEDNISNLSSGLGTNNFEDNFSTMSVTQLPGSTFDFSTTIVSGTVGTAIWVDWNNDLTFTSDEVMFTTTSYGGDQTGTITIPATAADGEYRMRLMIDWNDSNPGSGSACELNSGRGEIEDYKVIVNSTLSTTDFNNKSLFAYYPNPVNDNLTLKAQKEISNVSVYNMLGQEVYRNAPNSVDNLVNMSDLQSGAYFVKVTIDNVTETIKVIKK